MAFVIFLFSSATLFYFIYIYKKRSDKDWVVDYLETKHIDSSSKGFEILKQANIIDEQFCLSQVVNIMDSGWFHSTLYIDNEHRKFIYRKRKNFSKTYNFADLIDYEVYENGKSQIAGRAGSALIGGALFGLGGAIVGSSMSRNINEKCSQLILILRLNDINCSQITIKYLSSGEIDKDSDMYKRMKTNLQEVCSILEYILKQGKYRQSFTIETKENIVEQKTMKHQLQEIKELYDDGLITQEEFEEKKKQILGL